MNGCRLVGAARIKSTLSNKEYVFDVVNNQQKYNDDVLVFSTHMMMKAQVLDAIVAAVAAVSVVVVAVQSME